MPKEEIRLGYETNSDDYIVVFDDFGNPRGIKVTVHSTETNTDGKPIDSATFVVPVSVGKSEDGQSGKARVRKYIKDEIKGRVDERNRKELPNPKNPTKKELQDIIDTFSDTD